MTVSTQRTTLQSAARRQVIPPDLFPSWNLRSCWISPSSISSAPADQGRGRHGLRKAAAAAIHCRRRRPPEDQLPLHAPHPAERAPDHGLQASHTFKERSQKNTDNRKKQKTKHKIGLKSYLQVSFEKRNLELTHTNDGTRSNTES
ncbi:uncharacterized protein [Triticum aestivum]|uniref:uncharacterized protein isoform X3 n=1 Tax=Triticum aestivum TaxID=4565 RepID=UPI001D01A16F|nr:uncharacterized protein LOC123105475 isoform X3 [Triticum aestivum]